MHNNILRERPIPGCDNVITPAPLRTFVREGGELKEVNVNLDDYKKIGSNLNYDFYHRIEVKEAVNCK